MKDLSFFELPYRFTIKLNIRLKRLNNCRTTVFDLFPNWLTVYVKLLFLLLEIAFKASFTAIMNVLTSLILDIILTTFILSVIAEVHCLIQILSLHAWLFIILCAESCQTLITNKSDYRIVTNYSNINP